MWGPHLSGTWIKLPVFLLFGKLRTKNKVVKIKITSQLIFFLWLIVANQVKKTAKLSHKGVK